MKQKLLWILLVSFLTSNCAMAQKYKGTYTRSSQGKNARTGARTGSGPDVQLEVEIYDNYILVNGEKIEYWTTSSGWKAYKCPQYFDTMFLYCVDSNYNMMYQALTKNSYSGQVDMWIYDMKKGSANSSAYSSGSTYNGGTYNGNYSSGSSSESLKEKNKQYWENKKNETCRKCHGSGRCYNCSNGYRVVKIGAPKTRCVACPTSPGVCEACHGNGKHN